MWGAIKSDLIDFISTIKEDTSKTISNVLGDTPEDAGDKEALTKAISDLSRSFTTYSTDIDEKQKGAFQRFQKKFSLAAQSTEIAALLDREVDVPRFYADLVPAQLQPEQFWARYFFRLELLTRAHVGGPGGIMGMDGDDDDEELVWDEDAPVSEGASEASSKAAVTSNTTKDSNSAPTAAISQRSDTSIDWQRECTQLRATVKSLANRIAELEATNAKLLSDNAALRKLIPTDSTSSPTPVIPPATTVTSSSSVPVPAPVKSDTAPVTSISTVVSTDSVVECESESDSTGGAVLVSSRPVTGINPGRSLSPTPAVPVPSAPPRTSSSQQPPAATTSSAASVPTRPPAASAQTVATVGNNSGTSSKAKNAASSGASSKGKSSAKSKLAVDDDEEDESWD